MRAVAILQVLIFLVLLALTIFAWRSTGPHTLRLYNSVTGSNYFVAGPSYVAMSVLSTNGFRVETFRRTSSGWLNDSQAAGHPYDDGAVAYDTETKIFQ